MTRYPGWMFDHETACSRASDGRAVINIERGVAFALLPVETWDGVDGVDGDSAEPAQASVEAGLFGLENRARIGQFAMITGDLLMWASRRSEFDGVDVDTGESWRKQDSQSVGISAFSRPLILDAMQAFVEARIERLCLSIVEQNGGRALLMAGVGASMTPGVHTFVAVMSIKPGSPVGNDPLVLT